MNEILPQLKEIFHQSQVTAAGHQKNALILIKQYEKTEIDVFYKALKSMLFQILTRDYKIKSVYEERCIEFVALFCSLLKSEKISPNQENNDVNAEDSKNNEEEEIIEHPLLQKIFNFLLQCQSSVDETIRYRSCYMMNKIFDKLVGVVISNDLCDEVEDKLLERIYDPKGFIRIQAIIALHRLQDPSRQDDRIIKAFINFIQQDLNAKIRQISIEKVAIRKDVIPHLVNRVRDVDINVRLASYKRLSTLIEYLKIVDKRTIVNSGYLDTSEKIRDYVTTTLVPTWLDSYNGDFMKFMKAFRLDANEKDLEDTNFIIEKVLRTLFMQKTYTEIVAVLQLDEDLLIPYEYLNWETVNYWRILIEFLRENDDLEENTNKILPELVYFCKYIAGYYRQLPQQSSNIVKLEQQFVMKQMFMITKGYDLSDTASRQCLNQLVRNMLEKANLSTDVIEVTVSNLEKTMPNVDHRTRFVSEIISEIMYPMNYAECEQVNNERDFQMSQLKVKIITLKDRQNLAVEEKQYMEAENLKNEIHNLTEELKNLINSRDELSEEKIEKCSDIRTIIKYLDITAALLLSSQVTKFTTAIEILKNDVIQEMLIHSDNMVKAKAWKCYTLCCIIDKDTASHGIHILSVPIFAYQKGEECDSDILKVCICGVVDLIRIYGSNLVAQPPNEEVVSDSQKEEMSKVFTGGSSLTELIQGLVDLMDDEQPEVQKLAAHGLCSLLISDRIHSPSIISRLVIKWSSPATDGPVGETLKYIIGLSLQVIAKMPDSADQIEEAVLMTIKALMKAPVGSPLADIDIVNIAKFMVSLCAISGDGYHIHINLAERICSEMAVSPKAKINFIYSKILLMLNLQDAKHIVQNLLNLCDNLRDDLRDKQTLNNIVKFIAVLNNINDIKSEIVVEEECEE